MRTLTLAFPLLVLACANESPDQERPLRRSIGSISAVIGDSSFLAAFGRMPVATDDVDLRIQTHLLDVERLLRARDTTGYHGLRRAEPRCASPNPCQLARLMAFPIGESMTGFISTFIDDEDHRCAVAYLIETSEGMDLARTINEEFRNAFVADIESEDLVAWARA